MSEIRDPEIISLVRDCRTAAIKVATTLAWVTVLNAAITTAGGAGWTWVFAGFFAGAGTLAALLAYFLGQALKEGGAQ